MNEVLHLILRMMAEQWRTMDEELIVYRLNQTAEMAEEMERERDEAISSRKESAADWLNQVEQANARVSRALQQVAIAESERDELKKVLLEIAEASHFDNIGNWARNKAKEALK